MKVLLDECVDQRLAAEFVEHEVKTVEQMGWSLKQNGELLSLAEKDFEVFVTTDRNVSFQQNIRRFAIAVAVLVARTNRLDDLRLVVPGLLKMLPFLKKGEAFEISG